ncbi:MAG: hypothetical protein BWY26_01557 [Elusimicrobia bacterium ADurb.Bin231]|nr:MAG: hypothetical protein BWY26_01557 [Elusimicrobia bacterium ADurb.Bin231]
MKKISDMIVLVIGRVLIIATSVLSIRLLTTCLSPSEVGRYNIILAIIGWFGLVAINPVGMYVNRKINEWYTEGSLLAYLTTLGKYFLLVALAGIVCVFMFKPLFSINMKFLWLMGVVSGGIMFISANSAYISYINLLGYRIPFVLMTNFTIWISLLCSWFLVSKISNTAEYWFAGQLIGSFLLLLLSLFFLIKISRHNKVSVLRKDDFSFRKVFPFAWPLAISTLLYWSHTQGYRFIFQKVAGIEILGFFVVGFGIGSSIMITFETVFNQYYQPIFYSELTGSNRQQKADAWNRYASAFLPAIIITMVYVSVNGTLIAKLLTGERFHKVGNIILWGALAESFRITYSILALAAHTELNMTPLIAPGGTGVIVALFGILIFAKLNPFIGVGASLVAGWFFAVIHLYINMRQILPIRIPWNRIFYSLLLSLPLAIFVLLPFSSITNYLRIFIFLSITGCYMLFTQFILARKWLILPIKLAFIDEFEQRLRYWHNKL